jgi:uncharacterized protein YndB with AHSA1/START domain
VTTTRSGPTARAAVTMQAVPAVVFGVLCDPDAYPQWVVGARAIRSSDGAWPRAGTEFHHTVGIGPVTTDDSTQVLDAEPPHHLRLEVRFRPVGTAIVDIEVEEHPDGSRVLMAEVPLDGAARRWWNPAFELLMLVRNHVSLLRLRGLVAARSEAGTVRRPRP